MSKFNWTLVLHIWDGETWTVRQITGPSPSFNLCTSQTSRKFYFQDVSIFPVMNQIHLWLTPTWEGPISIEQLNDAILKP